MANKPITMYGIKLIIQRLKQGTSILEISRRYSIMRNTIKKYRNLVMEYGDGDQKGNDITDEEISDQIWKKSEKESRSERLIKKNENYMSLLKNKHMTKQMLWEKHKEEEGEDAYSNSQFCYYLLKWESKQKTVMVIGSKPGERMEVDYAGDKLKYINKEGGEVRSCEMLVCVLPYSDLIYCEAQEYQSQMNFVEGIGRSLHYVGGIPKVIVSNNLKSGVKRADKYEPELTELCEQISLSKLYGTYVKQLNKLEKNSLIFLDDFGLQPLKSETRLALLQIM